MRNPIKPLTFLVPVIVCFSLALTSCQTEKIPPANNVNISQGPQPPYEVADVSLITKSQWHGAYSVCKYVGPQDETKIKPFGIPEQKVSFAHAFLPADVTTQPKRTKCRVPIYPFDLKDGWIEGWVLAAVVVETNGRVSEIAIVEATDKRFVVSVLESILEKTCMFEPAKVGDQPVRCVVLLPYYFKLDRS